MDIEDVKKNFDEIRRAKGLKIDEICASLGGITRQALYNYMKNGATLATLNKIAAALGVEAWQLLKPQDEQTNTTGQAAPIMCPYCGKPLILTASKPETNEDTTNPEK